MASIEEVKAALAQAEERGDTTLNQIQSSAEQCKQRLTEAAPPIQGSASAARQYAGVLG